MKTEPAADEIGAIMALVEPWMHVDTYGQPYRGLITTRVPGGPYSFDGVILPDVAKVLRPASGKDVRAHLLDRAEAVLDALDGAGWQLTEYPRMEITGEVRRFSQFLDGTLGEPSEQGGISLRMRFSVDRPR